MTAQLTQAHIGRPKRSFRRNFRPLNDIELQQLVRRYMTETFPWVTDTTHTAYVTRYATVLEAMMYLRDQELRVIKVMVHKRFEGL